MATVTPTKQPWRCILCGATDDFVMTLDRLIHQTRRHVGRVVDADGMDVQIRTVSVPK